MRKIGILTSVYGMKGAFGCNYGAVLQGYALVNQLRQWGYDAYDIYYLSDNEYSPVKYGKIERTFRRLEMYALSDFLIMGFVMVSEAVT